MKFCMIGSLLPQEVFDKLVEKSKGKPSNAPMNFQLSFAKGLAQNGEELTVISFPTVATFPNGPSMYLGKNRYTLDFGTDIRCPAIINLPIVKQAHIFLKTYFYLKKWFKENKNEEKSVILYSDFPPYATACRLACKGEKNTKCTLFMTDLPTLSLLPHKKTITNMLVCKMDKIRENNYKSFESYILLTEYMSEKMGIQNKPYIVVEGFSDPDVNPFTTEKSQKKVIMYSGALSDVHDPTLMVEGFLKCDTDAELWIFGSGAKEKIVTDAAEKDSRIKYFGKVSREEVLRKQKEAHLLLSIKSSEDEFTKLAFPSKILEYMISGTPVMSTRVEGIPNEYFDYVFAVDDETPEGIAQRMKEVIELSAQELAEKGSQSKRFAAEEKNCQKQTQKIIDFLKG